MNSNVRFFYIIHFWYASALITSPEPRRYYNYFELKDGIKIFRGNNPLTNYFTLLEKDSHSILIGSKNVVYNISLLNLNENELQRIEWSPTYTQREICLKANKPEEDCNNYIRVAAKMDVGRDLLICGTNAYKPLCRNYAFINETYEVGNETDGLWRCPYYPKHDSTTLITDGMLYSATIADFGGRDPIIYREPTRTATVDARQLNEPNFISSVSDGNYVFFFFREVAVEHINCGKAVYSRVARVCKNDKGGPKPFLGQWTSFLKARLNCSVPGDYPFYFDEIQSTSQIVVGVYNTTPIKMIYGVFTTPLNGIRGSAICAFTVDSILKTFKDGYKHKAGQKFKWKRVPDDKVPKPRPGQCVENSGELPETVVKFVNSHSLMDESVPTFRPPLLVRTSPKSRFVAITVDPQVLTLDEIPMDVLFIGTDDGRVVKVIHKNHESIFSEEFQVNDHHAPIKTLSIARFSSPADWLYSSPPKLIIVTDDDVQTISIFRCSQIKICKECVEIQDPYCAWDTKANSCVVHSTIIGDKQHLLQNVFQGVHKMCPKNPPAAATRIFKKHFTVLELLFLLSFLKCICGSE